jgi:hypothetical protein
MHVGGVETQERSKEVIEFVRYLHVFLVFANPMELFWVASVV